jgi:pyruvate dehydrogenase E2 component (dihydrolipoamide acetyltransferase)
MSDPTITVTNLGEGGVESVFAIIYPPQVAIVGFGTLQPRPWAQDGAVRVLPTVVASLAADHRVSDGHRGSLFLAEIAKLLQEPEKL